MYELVRRIVAAVMNRLRPSTPPQDPYAAVREPRRRSPSGRPSAIALTEPEPLKRLRVVGTRVARTGYADSSEG